MNAWPPEMDDMIDQVLDGGSTGIDFEQYPWLMTLLEAAKAIRKERGIPADAPLIPSKHDILRASPVTGVSVPAAMEFDERPISEQMMDRCMKELHH